ncbi:MAG: Nif3-like dinuclear metal center hexameric protein [Cellulosilyticaceae bacterium]
MHSVREVVDFCHRLAPPYLAEGYDNVGLLIGDPTHSVEKILCALDLNEEVVAEAIQMNASCIITHHPFLFKAIKRIDTSTAEGRIIKALMVHDISLIAMHTNLDTATGGINDFLAEQFNLKETKPLKITYTRPMYKVSVYVPVTHEEQVRQAIIQWNPTTIGNYQGCTFTTAGMGTFLPLEGSKPSVGSVGALEKVSEVKIECMIDSNELTTLLQIIKEVHPYEEMAYDVYRLEHLSAKEGIGRWGFREDISLEALIQKAKDVFKIGHVRVIGDTKELIQRIAICSGSGSSFLYDAAGVAQVYVTGDMTFHEAQAAVRAGIVVLDVGHYASENIAMPLIKHYLEEKIPGLEVACSQVNGEVFKVL